MFTYELIARWLPFSVDPITIEDWIANREIFGADSKSQVEFEHAFLVEQIRHKEYTGSLEDMPLEVLLNASELTGLVEKGEELAVAPGGIPPAVGQPAMIVELTLDSEKPKKIVVSSGEILVVPVLKRNQIKIKVGTKGKLLINGKNEASWIGGGRINLIFDGRGRPAMSFDLLRQINLMKNLYERSKKDSDEN
jgi:hypothetical protein